MSKKDENLIIIDADSLVYIIGYELANLQLEPLGYIKLDKFIKNILITNNAKYYVGFFGKKCGKNYRYNIAKTKEYKGNRPKVKEPWYEYWEPILKKRMEEYWGFTPVCNIEADDACSIAVNKFRNKFNKVIVASPDKDLLQIPDTWFYDYSKGTTIFCNETVSMHKLCVQLIMGDSTDNIIGCVGAGKKIADDFLIETIENPHELSDLLGHVKQFYINWHTVILRDKEVKKQEKQYLIDYKKEKKLNRFTKITKSDALNLFKADLSNVISKKDAEGLYTEMYGLVKLLDTELEGKKHKFKLPKIIKDDKVDWSEVIQYQDELELLEDEQIIDDIEDFL